MAVEALRLKNYSTSHTLGLLGQTTHEAFKCQQITFKEFAKIEFPGEVPQFIEDFFHFMAGSSMRQFFHADEKNTGTYIEKLKKKLLIRQRTKSK